MRLDSESQRSLSARVSRGQQIIALGQGHPFDELHPEDRESFAKDAISDILTALLGPAGSWLPDATTGCATDGVEYSEDALNEARRIVESALTSYEGDAEDYARKR